MIEEKILNAVSEVTGISPDVIKGDSKNIKDVWARMMYYYLCYEKHLLASVAGSFVGKTASAAYTGALSFKKFIENNNMYNELTDKARKIILGGDIVEKKDWINNGEQEYIYVGNKKYSILDVSSRYFGEGYVGFVDDDAVVYDGNKDKVIKTLVKIAN